MDRATSYDLVLRFEPHSLHRMEWGLTKKVEYSTFKWEGEHPYETQLNKFVFVKFSVYNDYKKLVLCEYT